MDLSNFPRVSLSHLPTPMEYLQRLSKHLAGPNIYIKRDDCTGLASGGNKNRKLEFLIGDAIDKGANTIITHGTGQSNHLRLTAAATSKLGLKCELILEDRVDISDDTYARSGNVFLDKIFGANLTYLSSGEDVAKEMDKTSQMIIARGDVPYLITRGGSTPMGTLGYVDAAAEIIDQINGQNLAIDRIIHATASGSTQAGLVLGLKRLKCDIPVLGISANLPQEAQEKRVFNLVRDTEKLLGETNIVKREDITINSDYVGTGYGIPTTEMNDAILLLARQEGLLFDPVYSGKALAGMIDLIKKDAFDKSENILFIHTGGAVGLFAYLNQLDT